MPVRVPVDVAVIESNRRRAIILPEMQSDGDAVFTFVTGLKVGYGDTVPR